MNKYTLLTGVMSVACLCFASQAHAGVGKINSPQVDKGKKEIEINSTYAFDYDNNDDELEVETEFEYGLTEKLLLEVEAEIKKENGEDTELGGIGFGVRYELSEPGLQQ